MSSTIRERFLDLSHALDHPVFVGAAVGLVVVLSLSILLIRLLYRARWIDRTLYEELVLRWRSWWWLFGLMLVPLLLGAGWVILAVTVLSLLCYREYARVTGLFREKATSLVVVLGIVLVGFACLDHYDRLFFACAALTCGMIAIVTIPQDRPRGYIQRVALGVLGFVLLGYSLGYLGYLANAREFRPILALILVAVELNDVFVYCLSKAIGGPQLLPATSPGKTMAGAAGALILTTGLVTGLGHVVFRDTPVDRLDRLLMLGVLISVLGQLGDLMLSSIKRDVAVKETGAAIPGHGGLLDRFDSLVLVPPAVYHLLSLWLGSPLAGSAQRLLTGPP